MITLFLYSFKKGIFFRGRCNRTQRTPQLQAGRRKKKNSDNNMTLYKYIWYIPQSYIFAFKVKWEIWSIWLKCWIGNSNLKSVKIEIMENSECYYFWHYSFFWTGIWHSIVNSVCKLLSWQMSWQELTNVERLLVHIIWVSRGNNQNHCDYWKQTNAPSYVD